MDYDTAKANIFAYGTVADGWQGHTHEIGFAIVDGKLIMVNEYGCSHYAFNLDAIDNEAEAMIELTRTKYVWDIRAA